VNEKYDLSGNNQAFDLFIDRIDAELKDEPEEA